MEYFDSINDAAQFHDGLQPGNTEIWYAKKDYLGDAHGGYGILKKYDKLPDLNDLSKTHVLLGKVQDKDKNSIFQAMQGDFWSPTGEARNLIRNKGLAHTSMSVGDIVVINGKPYMVDLIGWTDLETGKQANKKGMNALRKIALQLKKSLKDVKIAKDKELRLTLTAFFEENPNPSDDQIHKLADDLGINKTKLENEIYSFLGSFLGQGFYVKYGQGKTFDENELKLGIDVEMEHTDCVIMSERIAKDHLTEIPDYYTRLNKLEEEAKAEGKFELSEEEENG